MPFDERISYWLRQDEWIVGSRSATKQVRQGVSAIIYTDGTWIVLSGTAPLADGREDNQALAAMAAMAATDKAASHE